MFKKRKSQREIELEDRIFELEQQVQRLDIIHETDRERLQVNIVRDEKNCYRDYLKADAELDANEKIIKLLENQVKALTVIIEKKLPTVDLRSLNINAK